MSLAVAASIQDASQSETGWGILLLPNGERRRGLENATIRLSLTINRVGRNLDKP